MKVVISTITDLQPFWLPRAYPHTRMLDEFGQPVRGTPREECLPGLTPGQCTDHPEILALSKRFMRELARRYSVAPALAAWDCWNETRWACCSDRWVCYCPATINAFHIWLRARYGSLEALSEAWGQRLTNWEDVMPARSRSCLIPSVLDWFRFMAHRSQKWVFGVAMRCAKAIRTTSLQPTPAALSQPTAAMARKSRSLAETISTLPRKWMLSARVRFPHGLDSTTLYLGYG